MEVGFEVAKEYAETIERMPRDFQVLLLADMGFTLDEVHEIMDEEEPHLEIINRANVAGRTQQLMSSIRRTVALRRAMRLMLTENPDYEDDPFFGERKEDQDRDS